MGLHPGCRAGADRTSARQPDGGEAMGEVTLAKALSPIAVAPYGLWRSGAAAPSQAASPWPLVPKMIRACHLRQPAAPSETMTLAGSVPSSAQGPVRTQHGVRYRDPGVYYTACPTRIPSAAGVEGERCWRRHLTIGGFRNMFMNHQQRHDRAAISPEVDARLPRKPRSS